MFEGPRQPIKATVEGKGGRKHTLAPISIGEDGRVVFHFLCVKSGCGCSADYSLEELLAAVEQFKQDLEGRGELQHGQGNGESWAA